MASLFTARRKPKRIASSEPRDDGSQQPEEVEDDNDNGPVVRRPNTAPKQKSKLRISFDPGESTEDSNTGAAASARVKNTSSISRNPATSLQRSRDREEHESERPSYSKSYLDELKGSTPSTPKDLSHHNSSAEDDLPLIQPQTQALDIASKFGPSSSSKLSTAIPSAAEIAEKKERRNRLAKEAQVAVRDSSRSQAGGGGNSVRDNDDFISLDAYDSDCEFKPSRLQVSSYLHADRQANDQEYTRLIPEDEDIAEGFDTFVDDDNDNNMPPTTSRTAQSRNRIPMAPSTNPAHQRSQMRTLIAAAEGISPASSDNEDNASDNSSDSDASASKAYMAAQTQHGTSFSHLSSEQRRRHAKEAARPRQPDKTTPIPTLSAGLARLRELKEQADLGRQRAERRKVEIERRLREVEGEKGRIQSALEEVGRLLEESSRRVEGEGAARNGTGDGTVAGGGGSGGGGLGSVVVVERGLDTLAEQS